MTYTPHHIPHLRARREHAARRHRRRRMAAVGGGTAALVLVLGLVLALVMPAGGHSRRNARTGAARGRGLARPRPRLSPAGLPLGTAPLRLSTAAGPTVHVGFRVAPRAGLLFDLDTGHVLWARNPEWRLPIASLTKMMTALLTVEHTTPRSPVLITREAVDQQGSKVGELPLNRHVPANGLLAGLLLPSGNDAAVALAQGISGTVPAFVSLMNATAAQLGLGCTRYSSPSGFYDAGNFSCADDLAELATVDIEQPRIERYSRMATVGVRFPIKGGKLFVDNNNPLVLDGYPGITGLKTGYTAAAGICLVATARRHGVRLGVVLLHSPNTGAQGAALLNAGFQAMGVRAP